MFSKLLRRFDGDVLVVPSEAWRECPRRQGIPPRGEPGPVGVPGVPTGEIMVGECISSGVWGVEMGSSLTSSGCGL